MLLFYSLTAIFIAWIWVDYYRLIDIYEPEKLKYFILTFVLGGLSVFVVFALSGLVSSLVPFEMNGDFFQDFLYCVFKIGMIEEFAKLLPFAFIFLFFRKEVNEPIDFVSYICVSALGFAAAENILYFSNYGPEIISGRSILSTVGHMMFAAFTAYGLILYKYKAGKKRIYIIVFYFFIGSLSHGIYDFWLMHQGAQMFGYLITIIFFLESISLFAIILNNSLNQSDFFTYKYVVNTNKVTNRLLGYYVIVFVIQFVLLSLKEGVVESINSIGSDTFTTVIIIIVCAVRFSRFKLIKGRWFPLRLELPFHFKKEQLYANDTASRRLRIRGESYNETYLNIYFQEYLWLNPLTKRTSYIKTSRKAFIERKIFLYKDETYYLAKIYIDDSNSRCEYVLLKPKLIGKKYTTNKSPIVAVLQIKEFVDFEDNNLRVKDFKFLEWAYPKEYEKWEK